eukprot:13431963-Ditylum_brightwellii.AAC.1
MTDNIMGRHMTSEEDKSRLGRWTRVCITRNNNRKLYVITVYCPCVQTNPGTGTVNTQQKRFLTMKGKPNVHVWKEWDKDTLSLIKQWRNKNGEISLMMDTNAGLEGKTLGEAIVE